MLKTFWKYLGYDEEEEGRDNSVLQTTSESRLYVSTGQEAAQMGSKFNQWQRPVTSYGQSNSEWLKRLMESPYVGDMDVGRHEWVKAQVVVDDVLRRVLDEMKSRVTSQYKGLRIDRYIRQGSSRDGLKVIAPNEFDIGFEFWIEGISFVECPVEMSGNHTPGFCYLKVNQSVEKLQRTCPELVREKVFQIWENDKVYLSSKMLHRAVFQSLIDQSCQAVENKIQRDYSVRFSITRRMNPPAVNITLHLDDNAYNKVFMKQGSIKDRSAITPDIDIDIIPALRLRTDKSSEYEGEIVNAPIHAICKWKEEESDKAIVIANQNFVWLINSVAYERHIYDFARGDVKQQYILTALRIVKTYCTRVEEKYKNKRLAPPPITVLQSYHLKQIACYVILYTCYVYKATVICSAREALEYLLAFLYICLDKERLPHFFYSNSKITYMFQNYPYEYDDSSLRFNLFRKKHTDALLQAKKSLKKDMMVALDTEIARALSTDPSQLFSSDISMGEFF